MDQQVKQQTGLSIRETARKFLDRETAGGIILIATTIVALVISNSSWSDAYNTYLHDEFVLELPQEHLSFGLTIKEWINDGLMAIFFLVAGLELKREILVGELSTFKKAAMPLFAALGGMLFPALIFIFFNSGTNTSHGWAIPMATDIAYSLGIISLLGKRVPTQLKVFLVALAIADDIGAILVILFFYSENISWLFITSAAGVYVYLWVLNLSGVKTMFWYILGGIILWYCVLYSGIHPTIAGVLFALTIPVKPKMDSKILKERTSQNILELEKTDVENKTPINDLKQREVINNLNRDMSYSVPMLLNMENKLVDFNAFFIIPLFALANAGVLLNVGISEIMTGTLGLGIILGLVLGKTVGIVSFSFITEKLGISEKQSTLTWKHIIGMATIAGVGFTMSLFITNLAFEDPEFIKVAKISILIASFLAAVIGILILLFFTPKKKTPILETPE